MISAKGTPWEGVDGMSEELLRELMAPAENAVVDAANYFVGEIKATLKTGERTGRAYKVSKTGPLHIASAPGEPPAVLYGALGNSIGHTDPKWVDGVAVECEVGTGLGVAAKDNATAEGYAERLEYGGTDSRGVYIAPRPYMEPTALRVQGPIEEMFAVAIGGAP